MYIGYPPALAINVITMTSSAAQDNGINMRREAKRGSKRPLFQVLSGNTVIGIAPLEVDFSVSIKCHLLELMR